MQETFNRKCSPNHFLILEVLPRAERDENTQTRNNTAKEPKQKCRLHCLSIGGHTTLGVGDLDAQSLRLGNDLNALPGRNGVTDLGGVGPVVHQEKLDIVDVLDKEGLVAGGGHVAGLLVGAVSNLSVADESAKAVLSPFPSHSATKSFQFPIPSHFLQIHHFPIPPGCPYLGHNSLTLEPPADAVINTLGLAPRGIDALEAVALVAIVVGAPSAFRPLAVLVGVA